VASGLDSYAANRTIPSRAVLRGMKRTATETTTFEYGTIHTLLLVWLLVVPTETPIGPLPGSRLQHRWNDPHSAYQNPAVGSPAPGDLLGAVNGRTLPTNTPQTQYLERSTSLWDQPLLKASATNGHPAATYTVVATYLRTMMFEALTQAC